MLLIDSNALAHRAIHSTGEMEFQGERTGVIYGFLNQVLTLHRKFPEQTFAFAWDSRRSWRSLMYPAYKMNRRKELNPHEKLEKEQNMFQFTLLRTEILPALGFANNWMVTRCEADDLIAMAVKYQTLCAWTIVSGDEDYWQLLGHCNVYSPGKNSMMTLARFRNETGLHNPLDWAKVKAIAGCSSDNIAGVEGVGETKAIQYLLNKLPDGVIKTRLQSREAKEIIDRNLPLVTLPADGVYGVPLMPVLPDAFSWERAAQTFRQYGLNSFLHGDDSDSWQEIFNNPNL